MATFKRDLHLPVECVDASEQFLSELKGVEDPERKRKIIGAGFIAVFDEFSHKLEKELGKKPAYLVQGTLYPDVIESCPPPGSGKSHSHTIKSHHNVGGLPANMQLKLVEPLKWLFKDEVRSMPCWFTSQIMHLIFLTWYTMVCEHYNIPEFRMVWTYRLSHCMGSLQYHDTTFLQGGCKCLD